MHRRRTIAALASPVAAAAAAIALASPAVACGGLVGENGTIRLEKTTTLAAYHDGVEDYVTSFSFSGEGKELGAIIPLPGIPTTVERAGSWTLQRLEREVTPERSEQFAVAPNAAADAVVLQQVQVDALGCTVLQGGGDEVGRWAIDHDFLLSPDAPEVLDFYGRRSSIFLAARFDVATAKALNQQAGDGTPIHIAIPTRAPWVPLRILALGLDGSTPVKADVFLLTDDRPDLLFGPGTSVERSLPATASLLSDLASDKNSSWVPQQAWFTHVAVGAFARQLDYDLAVGVGGAAPSPEAAGALLSDAPLLEVQAGLATVFRAGGDGQSQWLVGLWIGGGATVAAGLWLLQRRLVDRWTLPAPAGDAGSGDPGRGGPGGGGGPDGSGRLDR